MTAEETIENLRIEIKQDWKLIDSLRAELDEAKNEADHWHKIAMLESKCARLAERKLAEAQAALKEISASDDLHLAHIATQGLGLAKSD